ncbi:MAG: modulated sigma54 specific transcriptional regulator, Fis family, partial [Verrucomicrobiales bacterium]|nr:modulated sigma54 specific transcriptional regulator, Fis family [Verrucomicrobiales bacterium]
LSSHNFPGNVRELRNVLERSLLRMSNDSKWLALDLNWLNRNDSSSIISAASSEPLPAARTLTPVEAQEYRLIRETLREVNGGIRRASAKLGMSPQALLRRLEKWPELREAK